MLSTAESANIGFSHVVQLFAPPANPGNAPRAENEFYKFGEKKFLVSKMSAQILGFSGVRVRVNIRVSLL